MKRPDRTATCPDCKTPHQYIDETFHIGRVAPHYGDFLGNCDGGWPNPPVGFGPPIDFKQFSHSEFKDLLLLEQQIYLDDEESKNKLFELVARQVLWLVTDANPVRVNVGIAQLTSYLETRERNKDDYLALKPFLGLLLEAKKLAMNGM